MNSDSKTIVIRDGLLEALAAELAVTAYRVTLRARKGGTWLDLELELWKELAETVDAWGEGITPAPLARDAACSFQ
jgi:hypothetical protein